MNSNEDHELPIVTTDNILRNATHQGAAQEATIVRLQAEVDRLRTAFAEALDQADSAIAAHSGNPNERSEGWVEQASRTTVILARAVLLDADDVAPLNIRFHKKTREIQAVQWDGDVEKIGFIYDWLGVDVDEPVDAAWSETDGLSLLIGVTETTPSVGDWILKDPLLSPQIHTCDPEYFAYFYEPHLNTGLTA